MNYIADTIRQIIVDKVVKAKREYSGKHKIIVMLPSLPEKTTLIISDALSNYFLHETSIDFVLKIASVITNDWHQSSKQEAESNNWIDQRGNLTFYRNQPVLNGKFGLVLLFGADRVTDAASLSDFYTCEPDSIWNHEMKRSFRSWTAEKLKREGFHDFSEDDLDIFDRILKPIIDSGHGDLFQVSEWLDNLDISSFDSIKSIHRYVLGSLKEFGLPSMTSFPLWKKTKDVALYYNKSKDFFNYSLFLDALQREKALKGIDSLAESLSIGDTIKIPIEDDEVIGPYESSEEFLEGLRNYIGNNDTADREKLFDCDFVVIWDDILKFRKKVAREKKDTITKLSGGPIEVILTAIWQTLRDFSNQNTNSEVPILSIINIETSVFKHDISTGENSEENSQNAIEYLERLIGGIDNLIRERLNLLNLNGEEINVLCSLFHSDLTCRYLKNSEPILEFSVNLKCNNDNQDQIRRFGWRLPEHNMYRLSADLLFWANLSIESYDKSLHVLPTYHLSHYEELMHSSANDEVQRILLHSIRDESDSKARLTNLLAEEWSKVDEPIAFKLKTLADKYCTFIKTSVAKGLVSSIFSNNNAWHDLRLSLLEIFDVMRSLSNPSSSSVLGMLTRSFLIIQPRSINLGVSWHANYYERSGIVTVLHPSIIEMLEAQIVYLFSCFNYATNKEFKNPISILSFDSSVWQTYLDLSEIQAPLTGLLFNEELNLDTNVRGHELIHRIGLPENFDAPLSTRLLLNYQDNYDDEDLSDSELFRETSESRLLLRFIQDYFDLHPHSRDGLSLAVYRNKSIQPIVAAVHAFIKELARKPTNQQKNKRFIFDKGRKHNYAINLTFFTETDDETGLSLIVKQWKERWDTAENEAKYDIYRHCRFSVSNRIVNTKDLDSFIRLIIGNFDSDITVFYDFISSGPGGNKFENVEEFDVTQRDLKFPILEKASCTINSPSEKFRRKRVASNRQFLIGAMHANLLHSLKTNSIQKGTIVVGAGNYEPWIPVIDNVHKKSDWVICIDPHMDERLIKSSTPGQDKEREIIGFGSGVGTHGEDNFTVSTERFTLTNILNKLRKSIQSIYAEQAKWSLEDCDVVAKAILKEATNLSGLSLVRATGVGDEYIRDFMAYSLSRMLLRSKETVLFESLVSLDAFRHWFDLSKNKSRPDLLKISVTLTELNCLSINMHLVECKMAFENDEHINKAMHQIENGLRVLVDAFQPMIETPNSISIEDDRPDRRYWWMQLHRLIASKTEVNRTQYPVILSALERLANGDFKISWEASIYAFWINDSPEIKRIGYWTADVDKNIVGNIYKIGGGFVKNIAYSSNENAIDWGRFNDQGIKIIPQEILETISDEDENTFPLNDDYEDEYFDQSQTEDTSYTEPMPSEIIQNMDQYPQKNTEDISPEVNTPLSPEPLTVPQSQIGFDNLNTAKNSRVLLGKALRGDQEVFWEFGHNELPNRHILIFGMSGQGKTYAIQCILLEMLKFKQNSLIIDYTDGFRPDQLEQIIISQLNPRQHIVRQQPLPINPFLPVDSNSGGIRIIETSNNIASRISNVFNTVYNLGDQQLSVLHQAIMEGVEDKRSDMSLEEMVRIIEAMTDDRKYRTYATTLLTKLRPFVLNKPFSHGEEYFDWDSLFMDKDHICNIFQLTRLDLNSCKLITEFVLWDLYGYLQARGKKTDPKVIVLDEVQNLDHKIESPLAKYLTEGRKFGVSLILATQTISNLNQEERARMFNASHKLFFRPTDTELRAFAEIAAQSTGQNKDEWIHKLSELKKGECYSIGPSLDISGEKLMTKATRIRITPLAERQTHTV